MSNFDLVISYYNEDLDWINLHYNMNFRYIFIYNKGNMGSHIFISYY
jgi:hypothetical protein